ncbi:MAG: NADH-quinone oxidoreductase subunit A [Verrucomicrobiaceae bacterium]|nr:NADH-quinone oxidoreductase subunit A [Verrucomicrobiaceae bacterium]
MEISSYISVLVQIIVALAIPTVIIVASHIFGQRAKTNKIKDSAYECGIVPEGKAHPRYGAKFYLVAMLFVIFDIEVVFMLPIAASYPKVANGLPILLPILFFIAILCVGVIYEIKKDALNWNIPKSN